MRDVIAVRLSNEGGTPDIRRVADAIGTSVRTLQRRLHATGLTYATVVQQARYAAARRMLKDRSRRVGEIARLLGYSDHAHFTRAFQRWTGSSPREFRWRGRRLEAAPPGVRRT